MNERTKEPSPRWEHDVAVWAGVAAFFGSLLTIGVVDVINPDNVIKFASSIVVALITGGAVYSKQRLDDAKAAKTDAKSD